LRKKKKGGQEVKNGTGKGGRKRKIEGHLQEGSN
jgi:hypothetical protein